MSTSSPTTTLATVASPGKRLPSRRWYSASKISVLTGPSASIIASRRRSVRSRNSSGTMRLRIGLPIASAALQPNIRSAARFQAR